MKTNEFVCISCPLGCMLSVTYDGTKDIVVTGNKCKNGIKYAKDEMTRPMRVLTSTVKTAFKSHSRVSVRTDGEIPLELIFKAMKEINRVRVTEHLNIGDIVVKNILNTGVNVVITSSE